jgi:Cys-tRNA(Pro) deacylase
MRKNKRYKILGGDRRQWKHRPVGNRTARHQDRRPASGARGIQGIDLQMIRGYTTTEDQTVESVPKTIQNPIAVEKGAGMTKERIPVTPAILAMKQSGLAYTLRPYRYEEHGGTRVSSRELGVDEHLVIKTLVMEDDRGVPLIILMNGDRQVSTKALARLLGVKTIIPCDPRMAEKHTGYRVGGTSPFGTKKPLRIFIEEGIADLPCILINAGSRGLLAEMLPAELIRILKPVKVKVAL